MSLHALTRTRTRTRTKIEMTYKKILFAVSLILTSSLGFAQTFPNPNGSNLSNNQVNINSPQNNNQRLQPNIIISYPPSAIGSANNNSNALLNTPARTPQAQRPPATAPVNPGYDTTSSLGGPSNSQGSITYGSNGSIKTQNPK